jgi:hypothetical protein
MAAASKLKIYAYVDETGPDTLGKIFIVAPVVVIADRVDLRKDLQEIEKQSGRGERKWTHSNNKERQKYIERLLNNKKFIGSLFYSVFTETTDYTRFTILATARAIKVRARGEYQAIVFVDGLQYAQYPKYAAGLRKLHIKTRKVRGLRDGSDEFIRLADSIAGFVRDYHEGMTWTKPCYNKAVSDGFLKEAR